MSAVKELAPHVGQSAACRALSVPRASWYRGLQPVAPPAARPTPARALSPAERQTVLDHLHSERFRDKSPAEAFATLLDEGAYLCSPSTMYRLLAQAGEVKERRHQLRHPQYQKPELLATGPNQVWSWDITKLLGPANGPIFTCMSSWTSSAATWWAGWWRPRKAPPLAKRLLSATGEKQGIIPGQLTIHADRGAIHEIQTSGLSAGGSGGHQNP